MPDAASTMWVKVRTLLSFPNQQIPGHVALNSAISTSETGFSTPFTLSECISRLGIDRAQRAWPDIGRMLLYEGTPTTTPPPLTVGRWGVWKSGDVLTVEEWTNEKAEAINRARFSRTRDRE